MKKILISSLLTAALIFCDDAIVSAQSQQFFSTNLATASTNLLLTGDVKIAQIQLIGGANQAATVKFYDNNVAGNTNVLAAVTTRVEYVTNLALTNITSAGLTNIQTNTVWYETTVTNAASTNLLPSRIFIAPINTVATYPVNFVFVNGIVASTDTNVTVIVTYRTR